MRLGVVIYLALLSMWVQPTEVWKVRSTINLDGKCFSIPMRRVKFYVSCSNTAYISIWDIFVVIVLLFMQGNCLIKCPILL